MAHPIPPPPQDPHNWNSFENYRYLHIKQLEEHPLVRFDRSYLDFEVRQQLRAHYDLITVRGLIVCRNGFLLRIYKEGDIDRSPSRRVRMLVYSYNAWFPHRENVLRYDNMHKEERDVFHRHLFDPDTGRLISLRRMTRVEFPVMHQVLDELMERFPIEDPAKSH